MKGGPLQKGQNQPKKKGKLDGKQQYVSLGTQLQQQQPGTATHTTKAFKAEGHPSPAREGGAARKAATNSTTTKAFEKKAGPGLAQLLPDQGKGGGCGAQQPHQGLLGSPSTSSALLAGKGGRKCCSGPKACPSNGQA